MKKLSRSLKERTDWWLGVRRIPLSYFLFHVILMLFLLQGQELLLYGYLGYWTACFLYPPMMILRTIVGLIMGIFQPSLFFVALVREYCYEVFRSLFTKYVR